MAENKQQQDKKLSFFALRANKASDNGRSPPQELKVSTRSGLYLLVFTNLKKKNPIAHNSLETKPI